MLHKLSQTNHLIQLSSPSLCLPLRVIYLGRRCSEIVLRILITDILCALCREEKGDSCLPRLMYQPLQFSSPWMMYSGLGVIFHIITISFTAGVKARRERVLDSYRERHNFRVRTLLKLSWWDSGFFFFFSVVSRRVALQFLILNASCLETWPARAELCWSWTASSALLAIVSHLKIVEHNGDYFI